MDVGEFRESIRAYNQLLELRGKHVDEAVLGIMVRAVDEDMKDSRGQPGILFQCHFMVWIAQHLIVLCKTPFGHLKNM